MESPLFHASSSSGNAGTGGDDAVLTTKAVDQSDALIAFLGTFSAVEEVDVDTLNDGVQILDCLNEIAPESFPSQLLHRDRLDNWILRHSNLRKLLRHLQLYFSHVLHRSWTFDASALQSMAKGGGSSNSHAKASAATSMEPFLQAVAIAAVHHPTQKSIYVQRILSELSVVQQAALRTILVDTMEQSFLEVTEEPTLTEDMTETTSASLQDPFQLVEETKVVEQKQQHSPLTDASRRQQDMDESATTARSEINETVTAADYQRHMDAADAKTAALEHALEQLQRRYDEAMDATNRMADDLDVASAAQQQLYRAQATAAVYKERWEAMVDTSTVAAGDDTVAAASDAKTTVASLQATIAQLTEKVHEQEEVLQKNDLQQSVSPAPVPVSPDRHNNKQGATTQDCNVNDDALVTTVATLQQEVQRLFDAYQRKSIEHEKLLEQLDQSIAPHVYQQARDALSLARTEAYEWQQRAGHLERSTLLLQQEENPAVSSAATAVSTSRRGRTNKKKSSGRRSSPHEVMSRTIREYGLGMY